MKVKLKRMWQEPGSLKRWRPLDETEWYDFPEAHLKVLPSDARVECADGQWRTAKELRASPALLKAKPKE